MGWVRRKEADCLVDKYESSFCKAHHYCFFMGKTPSKTLLLLLVTTAEWLMGLSENTQVRYNCGVCVKPGFLG